MIRQLSKIGNSKGLILPQFVQEYLGLSSDSVEMTLENGKVILSAPERKQSFDAALSSTLEQFDEALTNLSK